MPTIDPPIAPESDTVERDRQPDAEDDRPEGADSHGNRRDREQTPRRDNLLGKIGAPDHDDPDPEDDHGRDERERAQQVESQHPVVQLHGPKISNRQDDLERSRCRTWRTGVSLPA